MAAMRYLRLSNGFASENSMPVRRGRYLLLARARVLADRSSA